MLDTTRKFLELIQEIEENIPVYEDSSHVMMQISEMIADKHTHDMLVYKWENLNEDAKKLMTENFFKNPLEVLQIKPLDLSMKMHNNLENKIRSEFDFLNPAKSNADKYVADPSIPSSSMASLLHDIQGTSLRMIHQETNNLHDDMKTLCDRMGIAQNDYYMQPADVMQGVKKMKITSPKMSITSKTKKSKKFKDGATYITEIHFYSPIDRHIKKPRCKVSSAIIQIDMKKKGSVYESVAHKLAMLNFRIIVGGSINEDNYCKSDDYLLNELYDIRRDKRNKVAI